MAKPKSKKTPAPAAVAPARIPDHWPKESLGTLPLKSLRPSPLNPRKVFDAEPLDELAASIKVQGVLQPIMVRPMGDAADWDGDKWTGVDHYEIIFGERRFRASSLARIDAVPVVVRPLTDAQVLELMLVENDQRADVRPSEQAAAYAMLVDQIGVEAVAERTGKSVGQVRDIIRLAKLPRFLLDRVDTGDIGRSVAAIVARVPGETAKLKLSAWIVAGWVDTDAKDLAAWAAKQKFDPDRVPTVADVKSEISRVYSRQLKSAPFDRKSLKLVEDAGSCEACPKRAGNCPELLAEGVRGDVCTDVDCYGRKVDAWKAAEIAKAVNKGEIAADEKTGINWLFTGEPYNGWVGIDRKLTAVRDEPVIAGLLNGTDGAYESTNTTTRFLIEKHELKLPIYVAINPFTHGVWHVVKSRQLEAAFEKAGLYTREKKSKATVSSKRIVSEPVDTDPRPKLIDTIDSTDTVDTPRLTIDQVVPVDGHYTEDEITDYALQWLDKDNTLVSDDEVDIVCRAWICRVREARAA